MNYSRAIAPTPGNKPGQDKRIDDKMEILLEQQKALEEAIEHYTKKISLNDWWKDWYENALTSYQKKYDKLMREIANTSGVTYESTKGAEAKAEVPAIGAHTTADKKEAITAKKP